MAFKVIVAVIFKAAMAVTFKVVMAVTLKVMIAVTFKVVVAVTLKAVMAVIFKVVMAVIFKEVMAVTFKVVMAATLKVMMAVTFKLMFIHQAATTGDPHVQPTRRVPLRGQPADRGQSLQGLGVTAHCPGLWLADMVSSTALLAFTGTCAVSYTHLTLPTMAVV